MGKFKKAYCRRNKDRRVSRRLVIHILCGGSGWKTRRGKQVKCSCMDGFIHAGKDKGK